MTTLIINGAQAAGQALVTTGKRYAVSYARRALRNVFDPRVYEGPRLETFHVLTSRDGAPMARVYGRARLAGQIIWASRIKEHISETRTGGKGGPVRRDYTYTISFAIGLCEGVIQGVDRLWVNGTLFPSASLNMRVYNGTEDQMPDPIIAAVDGDSAPAFRGTAYMVLEDFPLDEYGARLPQINAEVLRAPSKAIDEPRLEDHVTGINLLPASGEFAYAPDVTEDVTGRAFPVNMNNLSGQSDILQAIDQLEAQLPNCRNISLIISWFGTDLRAGHCEIKPGVETRERLIRGADWQVCGDDRGAAYLVTQDVDGRPHYGGTPSDASIMSAITALKARGFNITIYPFILMDIAPDNGLPDPYGGAEQAAFPWRGRIIGTDLNSAAASEIAQFFGACTPGDFGDLDGAVTYSGPDEYSFRRFILHYAKLAQMAGGVDRFVIGSEMRALTTTRSSAGSYPAIPHFKSLAADVRAMLGPQTGLTYAADWSEYFGHHVDGDVSFHLDPLWSDPNIDAVGIDAYFPLSDWRDGTSHLDADAGYMNHAIEYLQANVEGGEGYEWYYASASDRDVQLRTPITDGLADKPWVFRYKDIRNWWSHAHYNCSSGIESALPTAWVPESKPIWFTELGCPAIDKGANQPNVFVDPKSSESHVPYFSSGGRDDLIQRRYVESFLTYWENNNQISTVYNGPMVDMGAAHIWCWDARPYPDFPARADVWSDGPNWRVGHWLSGRTGLVPLRDIIRDIALQSGAYAVDVSRVNGLVEGYVIDRTMAAAAALEPLLSVYNIHMSTRHDGLVFVSQGLEDQTHVSQKNITQDEKGGISEHVPGAEQRLLDVRVHYIDGTRDYQPAMVSARDRLEETVRSADVHVPIVMDEGLARRTAEALLLAINREQSHAVFTLSPQRLDIETGDIVSLPGLAGSWRVESLDGIGAPQAVVSQADKPAPLPLSGSTPFHAASVPWIGPPEIIVIDAPDIGASGDRQGVLVGALGVPFHPVRVSGPDGGVDLTEPAAAGTLLTDLARGPVGRWDRGNVCDINMPNIDLASVGEQALLSGANRFAIETRTGWECIQVCDISLVGSDIYRVSYMLRGLAGTDADMMDIIPAGAQIVYLNRGLVDLPLLSDRIGDDVTVSSEAGGRVGDSAAFTYAARHLRPLSPVHPKSRTDAAGLHLSWTRRTRMHGDSWAGLDVPLGEEKEFYRVSVMNADNIVATYENHAPEFLLRYTEISGLGSAITHIYIQQGSLRFGYGGISAVEYPLS